MTNNDMLANIEYLREKANISYEEAEQLLEANDGNVMRVLVELEREGRVYTQGGTAKHDWRQYDEKAEKNCEATKKRTRTFVRGALRTKLLIEKQGDEEKNVAAAVPLPFAVAFALGAPWVTVATAGVVLATGYNLRLEKDEKDAAEDAAE